MKDTAGHITDDYGNVIIDDGVDVKRIVNTY